MAKRPLRNQSARRRIDRCQRSGPNQLQPRLVLGSQATVPATPGMSQSQLGPIFGMQAEADGVIAAKVKANANAAKKVFTGNTFRFLELVDKRSEAVQGPPSHPIVTMRCKSTGAELNCPIRSILKPSAKLTRHQDSLKSFFFVVDFDGVGPVTSARESTAVGTSPYGERPKPLDAKCRRLARGSDSNARGLGVRTQRLDRCRK